MALDGAFLHCIRQELAPLTDSRVDKIHQPTRDSLIITFRGKTGSVRVLFSAAADAARVHITQTSPENPAQPPMFCMLLRKHLSGGRLEAIEQDGLERILRFRIRCLNELGDSVLLTLVCEIMGRFSSMSTAASSTACAASTRTSRASGSYCLRRNTPRRPESPVSC